MRALTINELEYVVGGFALENELQTLDDWGSTLEASYDYDFEFADSDFGPTVVRGRKKPRGGGNWQIIICDGGCQNFWKNLASEISAGFNELVQNLTTDVTDDKNQIKINCPAGTAPVPMTTTGSGSNMKTFYGCKKI